MKNYLVTSRGIEIHNVESLNLAETFECGQCFRWNNNSDGSFRGVAFGKELTVRMENQTLILENSTEEDFKNLWHDYFDLDLNYDKIKQELCKGDKILSKAAEFAPGIRILKQDPWETLCSFLFSQKNTIPRIKAIISRFCQKFGEKCGSGDFAYSFPSPQTVANLSVDDLTSTRCGFRAEFAIKAAQMVCDGEINFDEIKNMSNDEARKKLITIKGCGPKIAECTLLYGMHRLDAFPIDVWIGRAMYKLYPGKGPEIFGKYAGIAQQYIFYYSRSNPQLFSKI